MLNLRQWLALDPKTPRSVLAEAWEGAARGAAIDRVLPDALSRAWAVIGDARPDGPELTVPFSHALARLDHIDEAVRQRGWMLMQGLTGEPAAFDAWNELWAGALSVHNRRLALDTARNGDGIVWRITPGAGTLVGQ